jgi:zinc protease
MKPTSRTLRRLGISFVAEKNGISEYVLKRNSLKIVLAPNPSARTACVVQHVQVGSRHEGAGTTGYAHLLEHMLFKGTPTRNRENGNSYDEFVKAHGNVTNATTSFDRTNYFAQIPVHALGTYLEYEADRLRNARITDKELSSEMPVVVKEFEIGENDPGELATKLIYGLAYTEHPYKVDTIGARSEVMKVTAAALKDRLYDVYYWPNNTTVIVVGGDESTVLRQIAHAYGDIPPSPRAIPTPYTVEPPQFGERRGVIRRPGDLPIVRLAFHMPEADHADHYAVAALCMLLGGNSAARLERALVEKGLAAKAGTGSRPTHDAGLFEVIAYLTPGTKPEQVERIMLKQIDWFKNHLVSKRKMASLKKLNRNGTLMARDQQVGFAMHLSENEAVADWQWGEDFDNNFDKVTAEDIQRVARQYLTGDNRTVVYFLPSGEAVPPSQDDDAPQRPDVSDDITSPTFEKTVLYPLGGQPAAGYAQQVRKVALPNGLTVLLMPTPSQAESALGFSLLVNAGFDRVPVEKRMALQATAEMLGLGSKRFSKKRIQELMAEMLAGLHWQAGRFNSTLGTLVPPADMPVYLDMVADGLLHPIFDAQELTLLKTKSAAQLEQAATDPETQAGVALMQSLYPAENPFSRQSTETAKTRLEAISAEDLRECHKLFGARGSVLAITGTFDADAMQKLVESKLGAWSGGEVRSTEPAATTISAAGGRRRVHIEGKDSIAIAVGIPAVLSKKSPDYLAAQIANSALGGDTMASRLGYEIRERRGLTYGVYSYFTEEPVAGGPWMVGMSTDRTQLERSISLIEKIVRCFLKDGIGEKELALEKSTLINRFAMSFDSMASVASAIAGAEYEGVGVEFLDKYEEALKSVTREQVNEAIRRYFQVDNATIAVAGTLQ